MAFTIYKSTDTDAPLLYGTSGSYLALLNACLVNGYGSKPGAGWMKPMTDNTSSTSGTTPVFGCFAQPTGSTGTGSAGMHIFINDNHPNATSLGKECWATGWEVVSDHSASVGNSVGTGSGQFPTPAQLLTNGHTVIRKSTTNDSSSARVWVLVADSSSFYSFIQTGDTANTYYGFGFGDIYSYRTSSNDGYRCIIMGRNIENSAAAANDGFDYCSNGWTASVAGNFMPRSHTQLGTSITIAKHGDSVKGHTNFYLGNIPFPNASDGALYLSPVWVVEATSTAIRGQLRGIYQPLHPNASFYDGQVLTGSVEYGGKYFMMLKSTPNAGMYAIEISNTVPTN